MSMIVKMPRRTWSVLAAVLVAGSVLLAGAPAEAQFGNASQVEFSAQVLPATDKLPVRLAITVDIEEGWHIYSITQAKGGPRPTQLLPAASDDYTLAGEFTPSVAPVIHVYEDIWPDLNVEEHTGTVTWTVPLKLADGVDAASLLIEGTVRGQVCNEEQCNNFAKEFEAELE
ncbi:MAG: hypothetical protein DWQ31_02925 [Planctomycetota bacterium]|nr:MAG: hypothetical protein DWQ31_02925 [Planctomycetota bacterium]REJ88979.1 MAG: hypothetical protein DWQ35_19035 [Planctomycetota bacterium]REK31227.1 MAG: hypothetical protein DWQ42_00895 [Planctomycetota bacterium]REK43565.1 MAG: hypothetical protein DWQ46_10780 [Planctomycetota bacterium]